MENKTFNIKLTMDVETGVKTHASINSVKEIISTLESFSLLYKIEMLKYDRESKLISLEFNIEKVQFNKWKMDLDKIKNVIYRNHLYIRYFYLNGEEKHIMDAFIDIFLSMDVYDITIKDWKYQSEVGMDKDFRIIKRNDAIIKKYDVYYNFDGYGDKENEQIISLEDAKELMKEYPDWNISHPF